MAEARKLSVIMFTDMVGYSRKVHENEAEALALLSVHNRILASQIQSHSGNVIKTIGDAFMADFGSVFDAVNCAVDIQKDLAKENEKTTGEQMEVRIGIHVGDVIYRESDVFGDGVNIASRIESVAGSGQIFISGDVFSIAYGKLDYPFKNLGSRGLKNIDRPIHIYEVLWDPARAKEANAEPPKVSRTSTSRWGSRRALVAAAMFVVAALSLIFFRQPSMTSERPTLAVVSFGDQTGDERLGRVQVGKVIGDAVVQRFYEFEPVQLVSPLQIMKVKKALEIEDKHLLQDPSLVETVAREANGRFVLSGSIGKIGNSFLLSAELNDLEKGRLISTFQLKEDSEEQILGTLVDSLCHRFQLKLLDVLEIKQKKQHEIVHVGELTSHSLEAYSHFIKGFELSQSGVFHPGIEEMIRATEIDSNFALAYSVIACAYSMAKENEASDRYFKKALMFRDRFKGISKESLIFKGNTAWFEEDLKACEKNYRLITELYPDDREGYYYYGLYFAYLKKDHPKALELLEKARNLSPEYYPIYRDMAYSIQATQGVEEAVQFLQGYIRTYSDGPGVVYARKTIAELRGVDEG